MRFTLNTWIAFAVLCLLFMQTRSQVNIDLGHPNITNYSSKHYKASPQNWAISQDQRGVMFFGNNEGVLEFDGYRWKSYKVANESAIRSLAVADNGFIYVGGVDEFGVLKPDRQGVLNYKSLVDEFNISRKNLGDVWKTHAASDGVYFMTNQKLFHYDGHRLKVWESESAFQSAYLVEGEYYINQLGIGLCILDNDSIKSLPHVGHFRNKRIYDIVPYEKDQMLVLTGESGIFSFYRRTKSNLIDEVKIKLNVSVGNLQPYNGNLLPGHLLAIGTWGHGLILTDSSGDLIQEVNFKAGLQDEVINAQFLDQQGNIWLALSNGISKVSFRNGLAKFGKQVNLKETIEDIETFEDKLFVATHTGVYYWKSSGKQGMFEKLQGIDEECWRLLSVRISGQNKLLIAENNGLYEYSEKGGVKLIYSCFPWSMHQSLVHPNKIFVGLDNGLQAIEWVNGKWIIQEEIKGVNESVFSIVELRKNQLWLGTLKSGVLKLEISHSAESNLDHRDVKRYDTTYGLPEGDVFVANAKSKVLFGTSEGIFEYDGNEDKFKKSERFSPNEIRIVHRMKEDWNGNLWIIAYKDNQYSYGFIDSENGEFVRKPLLPVAHEIVHAVHFDEKANKIWLGGPDGLYHIDPSQNRFDSTQYPVVIRRITLNDDSLLFAGAFANDSLDAIQMMQSSSKIDIPYSYNALTFEFASTYYYKSEQNIYQYKLVGFNDTWSPWTNERKAVFTNLKEGTYSFVVKSKNAYNEESISSPYSFTILSPWYRTIWAYLGYAVVGGLFVWMVVVLYTRRLKDIIKEKTSEVVAQKEEIVKQKNEVESQRKLLEMKNADILSSINYARRLQLAILPEEKIINEYLKDSFIYYQPKDIVSGDFYWVEKVNGASGMNKTLFAAVDCTGHGVPGAFVSVVGNSGLNRAVNEFGLTQPAMILEKLNEVVVDTLSRGNEEVQDGMDISLCAIDYENMKLEFAGAHNSAYLVRDNIAHMDIGLNGSGRPFSEDLMEIKADKQPVGYYEYREKFKHNEVKLQKDDCIYLFSDGFADQFGGPHGKKYNYIRFKKFLISIHHKPMAEQHELIRKEFEKWKGDEDQIDDVIVFGVKI